MKKYLISLLFPLFILACNPEVNPPADNSDKTPADTTEQKPAPSDTVAPAPKPALAAPINLRVETPGGAEATLTWENESTDYDGVELLKAGANGRYKMVGNIPAGTFSYHDTDFKENGDYAYRLCSYKGNNYTSYVTVEFTIAGIPDPTPQVTITKMDVASNMIVVRYKVTEDLGNYVESGIEWGEGESFTFWKKLRKDGEGLGVIIEPKGPVTVRVWAKSTVDGSIGYSETTTAEPAAEPAPYNVSYDDITPADLPSEIKVYNAHTTVTGRPLNIWYAIADLSTGNVELRALCPNGYARTSTWAKSHVTTPYVFTNGGYFANGASGTGVSLSYVLDHGSQKAEGESFFSRTDSYYAARGVFGVTSTGESSVSWRFGRTDFGGPYFYDQPIPQIDGAAKLQPSATFPSVPINPNYYSAIGAGPVLVKDGKIRINYLAVDESQLDKDKKYLANFELFPTDIYNKSARHPRTAIGRTVDGKVVLMVVDGRNTGVSEGVILLDLARLLTGVGCVDALNLDGGGSSVFCAGQDLKILNHPSGATEENPERSVISMVGFAKPE